MTSESKCKTEWRAWRATHPPKLLGLSAPTTLQSIVTPGSSLSDNLSDAAFSGAFQHPCQNDDLLLSQITPDGECVDGSASWNPSPTSSPYSCEDALLDLTYISSWDLEQESVAFWYDVTDDNTSASSDAYDRNVDQDGLLPQHCSAPLQSTNRSASSHHGTEASNLTTRSIGSRRHARGKRSTLVKDWLRDHALSPYATERQISKLATATGLSDRQVRVCLSNLRARKPAFDWSKDLLLSQKTQTEVQSTFPSKHWPGGDIKSWSSIIPYLADTTCDLAVVPSEPYFDALPQTTNLDSPSRAIFSLMDTESVGSSQLLRQKQGPTVSPKSVKRKGKRSYPSRFSTSAVSLTSPPTSDDTGNTSQDVEKAYHCTVCPKSFKDAYGWKRHESGVHDYHVTRWTCMLNDVLFNGLNCAFCAVTIVDFAHFEKHNIHLCLNKHRRERIFARKDLLKQHVLQVHLVTAEEHTKRAFSVPDSWTEEVDAVYSSPESLWCGFCQVSLQSTASRMDHVAEHFRNGQDMSAWQPPCVVGV